MADDQEEKLEQEVTEQAVRDTEDDLLKGAFEPKTEEKTPPETVEKAPPAEAAPPAEQPTGERARDPATGQFVKRAAEAPAQAPAQQAPAPGAPAAPGKPEEEILPSWRAREINDERRAALAEAERLRVENARLAAWVAQQQRAAQQPQQQLPDPVLDPAGYTRAVQEGLRAEFAQKQMSDRLEMNLELTHAVHGETFEKAFEAVCAEGQRGNNKLVRELVSQPNPGRAIIAWHRQQEVLRMVGGDPEAFTKKMREDLLNDPKFLAEANERARAMANGQVPAAQNGQQRPNTVVRLPPSLSRATGSDDVPLTATDGSESALFANAFTGKRR